MATQGIADFVYYPWHKIGIALVVDKKLAYFTDNEFLFYPLK
jgi:hypothetical protein